MSTTQDLVISALNQRDEVEAHIEWLKANRDLFSSTDYGHTLTALNRAIKKINNRIIKEVRLDDESN